MGQVFAATDIGSNTIHVLIAEVENGKLVRIENKSEWLALGEIVAKTGKIPDEKVVQLIQLLRNYQSSSTAFQASNFYVFATEAMRVATNSNQVLNRIKTELGVKVDLISPRREAEFSFGGVSIDTKPPLGLLLEVGGGSAQIAICEKGSIASEYSLPIGTGKLQAEVQRLQSTGLDGTTLLQDIVNEHLSSVPKHTIEGNAVASGGIARGLWRALHPDGEQIIFLPEIEYIQWTCSRLNRDQICKRFGVKSKTSSSHASRSGRVPPNIETFWHRRNFRQ
ncbi:MAG: hypothetical protein ABL921_33600 [Pirellula sp.]